MDAVIEALTREKTILKIFDIFLLELTKKDNEEKMWYTLGKEKNDQNNRIWEAMNW